MVFCSKGINKESNPGSHTIAMSIFHPKVGEFVKIILKGDRVVQGTVTSQNLFQQGPMDEDGYIPMVLSHDKRVTNYFWLLRGQNKHSGFPDFREDAPVEATYTIYYVDGLGAGVNSRIYSTDNCTFPLCTPDEDCIRKGTWFEPTRKAPPHHPGEMVCYSHTRAENQDNETYFCKAVTQTSDGHSKDMDDIAIVVAVYKQTAWIFHFFRFVGATMHRVSVVKGERGFIANDYFNLLSARGKLQILHPFSLGAKATLYHEWYPKATFTVTGISIGRKADCRSPNTYHYETTTKLKQWQRESLNSQNPWLCPAEMEFPKLEFKAAYTTSPHLFSENRALAYPYITLEEEDCFRIRHFEDKPTTKVARFGF
jgi:hypothetical protein